MRGDPRVSPPVHGAIAAQPLVFNGVSPFSRCGPRVAQCPGGRGAVSCGRPRPEQDTPGRRRSASTRTSRERTTAMTTTDRTHANEASGSGRRKNDGVKPFVILLGVLATFVGGALGGSWLHLRLIEASATSPAILPPPAAASPRPTAGPLEVKARAAIDPEAIHTDIYFDFKSARLRADSVRVLQEDAGVVARSGDWVVLVQGYADGQGPIEYNRKLAQRRAEEVKRFLVELGVTDTAIKVVTIGPDGALCDDSGPECQRLNRRVHLEMRRLSGISSTAVRPAVVDGDTPNVTPATSSSPATSSTPTTPTPPSQATER